MSKRVCKTLTQAQPVDVIERLDKNESQTAIATAFSVKHSQISGILKNKDKITEEWPMQVTLPICILRLCA